MVTAIIPAAGQGKRMGKEINKVFIPLGNRPLIAHTVLALAQCPEINQIIVAAAVHEIKIMSDILANSNIGKEWRIVAGGTERQYSIANALKTVPDGTDIVIVHDGARALIEPPLVTRVIEVARQYKAAALAMPVKETIKLVNEAGLTIGDPAPRKMLWAMQTPQAFEAGLLLKAYACAERDGFIGTDDAGLVERLGTAVKIVTGSYRNIKITSPEDLLLAEMLSNKRREL
ncbi:4-diphosphocytidyl-2c-methyl-d-erythritol synthase signature [Lucifera butyrica]|uniref:2-C-methyl-D-erythritol 4-phosphate cytidylyltransferase n=1 Tax=Lucifera butyrica TaxID=1351585 RepID=A0A498REH4_9FIRM|nr:2-C-methyl-D-erythritol 4-phosphate cytidylyltransferase [Lucifera butyrica]VBB08502.1 4-diphosphocytidyl-2c-methyl-d-erythritol synthase signature [Lucifera butyrica]